MSNILKISILSVLLFTQLKIEAQFCFTVTPTNPATSLSETSFGTNDFNNDGKPDFYVAFGSGLSIILQRANANLDTVMNIDSTTFSNTSCTADFNNDGNADIVTYNYGPGEFSIYLGNGNGTFLAPTLKNIGLFNANNSIYAADFNNDGKIDLAISTSFNIVRVYLGNGNGTFGNMLLSNTTTNVSGQLISVDFNNDGKMDLVTPSLVMLGDGLGGFAMGTQLTGTYSPQSISCADFNSDGKLDIATLNWGTSAATAGFIGNTSVFLGDGLGGFSTPIFSGIGDSTIPLNTTHNLFINADYDGDGKTDLVIGTYTNFSSIFKGQISILKGNGLGSFSAPVNNLMVAFPSALLALDINQDGQKDIAAFAQQDSNAGFKKLIPIYRCNPTNMNEANENIEGITIFPNPSNGVLTISSLEKIDEIKIVNMLGQIVFQTNEVCKKNQVHLLNTGIYFINIKQKNQLSTHKVTINN